MVKLTLLSDIRQTAKNVREEINRRPPMERIEEIRNFVISIYDGTEKVWSSDKVLKCCKDLLAALEERDKICEQLEKNGEYWMNYWKQRAEQAEATIKAQTVLLADAYSINKKVDLLESRLAAAHMLAEQTLERKGGSDEAQT